MVFFILLTLKIKLSVSYQQEWVQPGIAKSCTWWYASYGKTTGKTREQRRGPRFYNKGERGVGRGRYEQKVHWSKLEVWSGLSLAEVWQSLIDWVVAGQRENLSCICWGSKVQTSSCWLGKGLQRVVVHEITLFGPMTPFQMRYPSFTFTILILNYFPVLFPTCHSWTWTPNSVTTWYSKHFTSCKTVY